MGGNEGEPRKNISALEGGGETPEEALEEAEAGARGLHLNALNNIRPVARYVFQ